MMNTTTTIMPIKMRTPTTTPTMTPTLLFAPELAELELEVLEVALALDVLFADDDVEEEGMPLLDTVVLLASNKALTNGSSNPPGGAVTVAPPLPLYTVSSDIYN